MPNKPANMPNDASLQSTKQMLDELDALMEKMLTLPVNDLEDGAALPPMPVQEPTLTATLTMPEPVRTPPPVVMAAAPASKRPASAPSYQVPVVEAPAPVLNPPHFEVPVLGMPSEPAARYEAPALEPLSNEVMPPSVLPALEPLLTEIAEPTTSVPTQWFYMPLVWANEVFDHATFNLGGAGVWLRSQGGRMVLGCTGLGLMAAAVGWFLKDYLGWNW